MLPTSSIPGDCTGGNGRDAGAGVASASGVPMGVGRNGAMGNVGPSVGPKTGASIPLGCVTGRRHGVRCVAD
jgi:hypothetical protein